jgi:hypothetical protein
MDTPVLKGKVISKELFGVLEAEFAYDDYIEKTRLRDLLLQYIADLPLIAEQAAAFVSFAARMEEVLEDLRDVQLTLESRNTELERRLSLLEKALCTTAGMFNGREN